MKEHDIVYLKIDIPEEELEENMIGTIVFAYTDKQICEVEFTTLHGSKVVTLSSHQIGLVVKIENTNETN